MSTKPPPRRPAGTAAQRPPPEDRTDPGGPAPAVLAAARAKSDLHDTLPAGAPGDATLIYDKNKARPAEGNSDSARLLVVGGPRSGSEFSVTDVETSIGRGSENTVVIPDISVSRKHVIVLREGDRYLLVDQGSGNGTRVNGKQVARHALATGDEIAMGDTVVQFIEAGGVVVRSLSGRGRSTGLPPGQGSRGRGAVRAGAALHEAEPEITHSRAPGLARRAPLYGAVLALLVAVIGAGLWRRHQREQQDAEAARAGEEGHLFAQQRFDEAVRLVKEGRWPEARDRLKSAAELEPQDSEIARWLHRAEAEAPRAQAVAQAKGALQKHDYAAARAALSGIPEDSAVADAAHELAAELRAAMDAAVRDARGRAEAGDSAGAAQLIEPVLAADPQRSDALAVREAIGDRRPAPAAPPREKPQREPKQRAEPVQAAGPVLDAYLAGDIGTSIERADSGQDSRSQKLSHDLKAFDAAYRDGLAKAQQKRAVEAISALEKAEKLDRGLSQGKDSRLGREVRRALANLNVSVGIAALSSASDDGLPGAAQHLRAAVAFDPQNEQAQAQLAQLVARAKEIYLRGYVAKDSEPDTARHAFKLVIETLPASDETAQKAKRWLDKLEGKGPKEDG